jgi:hypothetical protein
MWMENCDQALVYQSPTMKEKWIRITYAWSRSIQQDLWPIKESIDHCKFSHIVKPHRFPYANLTLWFMKWNISKNQTMYILLKVSNTHSWYLRLIGEICTCVPYGHWESLCTQEFWRIFTQYPKGLRIVFLYSLLDGCNTWPSSILEVCAKACFKLLSCLELYLRDQTPCLHIFNKIYDFYLELPFLKEIMAVNPNNNCSKPSHKDLQ